MSGFSQDYYAVLGLNKRKATQEDVYKAYCKMAIRWHPDKLENRDKSGEVRRQAEAATQLTSCVFAGQVEVLGDCRGLQRAD